MIKGRLEHFTANPRFALIDLVCVFIACALWYIQPQLQWWPLLIALAPPTIRLLSGKTFIQRTPFDIAIVIFLLTAGVGVWAAYNRESAWAKFWIIVSAVLLYYSLAGQPRTNLWLIVGFWAFIGVGIATYFLLAHNWQIKPAKVEILNQIGLWWMSVRPRIPAPGIHPNDAGGMMAMMTPFLLALGLHAYRQKRIYLVLLVIIGCLLALFGLLLTTSRGAWLALSAGLCIWMIWWLSGLIGRKIPWQRSSIFFLAIIILGSLGLMFIYFYPSNAIDILGSLPGPASAESRIELARQTYDLISDFPFTGGGLRNFPGLYSQYILGIPFFYLIYSHNIFLDVALEQGFIGLVALLVVYIGTIWILLTFEFQGEQEIKNFDLLRGAIFISLLVMFLHGLVDNVPYGNLGSPLVFFQAGMAISLTQLDPRFGVQQLSTMLHPATRLSGQMIRGGITVFAFVLIALLLIFRKPLQSMWYANLGSVEMASVELAGFPTGKWDDGGNVAALEPAEGLFRQALTLNPNNRTANHRLGLIAMLKHDFPTAVAYLETAYQNDSDHRGIRKSLGYSYLWSGQSDPAIALLSEFPDSGYEVGNYFWFWENLGRSDLASIARTMTARLESTDIPMTGTNPVP